MSGRPKAELVLNVGARTTQGVDVASQDSAGVGTVSPIVLARAECIDNKAVSAKLRVTQPTVSKWRARFVAYRPDGLLYAPRPDAPRPIGDAHVDAVVAEHWNPCLRTRRTGVREPWRVR